jgi:hypothetical protein
MNSCISETVFTTTQFAIATAAPRVQQHSQKTEQITQMIKHAQLPSPGLQLLVAMGMRWVGACGMHRRGEKYRRCWWESWKERDHSEDQGIDGKMGSEWILGRLAGGWVDWIQLAQYRDRELLSMW